MKLNIHFTCLIPDRFIGTHINKLFDSHSFWMRTVPSPFFQTGGGGECGTMERCEIPTGGRGSLACPLNNVRFSKRLFLACRFYGHLKATGFLKGSFCLDVSQVSIQGI